MKKILKYHLALISETQKLDLPIGFKIVAVQNQNNHITIWAEVENENDLSSYNFRIVGTGWDMVDFDGFGHAGTVQIGQMVWHVYVEQ